MNRVLDRVERAEAARVQAEKFRDLKEFDLAYFFLAASLGFLKQAAVAEMQEEAAQLQQIKKSFRRNRR